MYVSRWSRRHLCKAHLSVQHVKKELESMTITVIELVCCKHEEIKQCQASKELQAFFIGVLVVYCFIICNECIIVGISMRGSVMNTRPRQRLPLLIYMQLFLYESELRLSVIYNGTVVLD